MTAAAELIGEIGPNRMRLSDIGERAGYSRGLATHYFGTKGDLVRQIMDTVTDDFHRELAGHDQTQGAVASVSDIVETYLSRLRRDEPMIRARIALWAEAASVAVRQNGHTPSPRTNDFGRTHSHEHRPTRDSN